MRSIEFRGKSKANGQWLYGDLLRWGENGDKITIVPHIKIEDIDVAALEVDSETVGQFTGLLDKKGKKIYEVDILQVTEISQSGEVTEYESPVEWLESGFLVTEPNGTQVPLACFHVEPERQICPLYEIEIIGNIHNNPELLKEATP